MSDSRKPNDARDSTYQTSKLILIADDNYTIHDSPETTLAATQAGVARVFPKSGSGAGLIKTVEELLAKEPPLPKSSRANA